MMIKRLARVEGLEKADSFPKGTVSIAAPGTASACPWPVSSTSTPRSASAEVARQAGQGDRWAEGAFEQPQVRRLRAGRGRGRSAGEPRGASEEADQLQRHWTGWPSWAETSKAGQRQTAGWRCKGVGQFISAAFMPSSQEALRLQRSPGGLALPGSLTALFPGCSETGNRRASRGVPDRGLAH